MLKPVGFPWSFTPTNKYPGARCPGRSLANAQTASRMRSAAMDSLRSTRSDSGRSSASRARRRAAFRVAFQYGKAWERSTHLRENCSRIVLTLTSAHARDPVYLPTRLHQLL